MCSIRHKVETERHPIDSVGRAWRWTRWWRVFDFMAVPGEVPSLLNMVDKSIEIRLTSQGSCRMQEPGDLHIISQDCLDIHRESEGLAEL